jgi:hypothetical protein
MWLPVSGLAAYAPQFPVKNGVKPSGCGDIFVKFSHPTSCPLASGIAMWTKCPDVIRYS